MEPRGPVAVSEDDLVALADELGHPVYWAGAEANTTTELTVTGTARSSSATCRRHRRSGEQGTALTVATYPVEDAYARHAERRLAEAVSSSTHPATPLPCARSTSKTNVYLAYPDEDVQVEVYSPVPGEADSSSRRERSSPSARDGRTRRSAP